VLFSPHFRDFLGRNILKLSNFQLKHYRKLFLPFMMEVKKLFMEKIISQKQLEANRRNAQLSTGPRSEEGKSASRRNAIKHGLLARQVVARGYLHQESPDEFKTLCREYRESLAPVGPLEEMLVGQIIMVVWRLRRVRMAEAAEVATNVDDAWWNPRRPPWEIGNGYKGNALDSSLGKYGSTVKGIEFVIECLQELRAAVETSGEFTEAKLKELRHYVSEPNEIVRQLAALREWLKSNPENLAPDELRARHLKDVLDYLDEQIAEFEEMIGERQQQIDAEDAMRRAVAMLPNGEVLDKIVRYESALQRQLYRSMNQLERLQRRRLGENVPPPVVMDVSVRG
jgi:hypothetical protein